MFHFSIWSIWDFIDKIILSFFLGRFMQDIAKDALQISSNAIPQFISYCTLLCNSDVLQNVSSFEYRMLLFLGQDPEHWNIKGIKFFYLIKFICFTILPPSETIFFLSASVSSWLFSNFLMSVLNFQLSDKATSTVWHWQFQNLSSRDLTWFVVCYHLIIISRCANKIWWSWVIIF